MIRPFSLSLFSLIVAIMPAAGVSPCRAEPTAEEKRVAADYLNAVVEARTRLHEAGFTLGRAVGPLVREAKDIDVADAEAKYDELKKTLNDAKRAVDAKTIPSGDEGAAIGKAWKAFAKVQTRVVEIEMAAIICVLDDRDLDNEGKKGQILKLIDRIVAKEKMDSEALTEAQKALQTAFNLEAVK